MMSILSTVLLVLGMTGGSGTQESGSQTRVDEFIEFARGVEHLTGIPWCGDCETLEVAAIGMSTGELVSILDHGEPSVRATAMAVLYLDGRTEALPSIFALLGDAASAPPQRSTSAVVVEFCIGDTWPTRRTYFFRPQTVGEIARSIVGAHLGARYRVHPRGDELGFEDYWREHRDLEHCLGWFKLAGWRAARGSSGRDSIHDERIKAFRKELNGVEDVYRDWLLLALASPGGSALDLPKGSDLASTAELLVTAHAIGQVGLMALLDGASPAVTDPDMRLGPDSLFPYERVASFVLRHAAELIPDTTTEELLELERRHLIGEAVGQAPRFNSPLWSIAAADLSPDRARTILRGAFHRHGGGRSTEDQGRRAVLAMALWRHAGEQELGYLVDWFFGETPADGYFGGGRHLVAKRFHEASFRPLLLAVLRDWRVTSIDDWTFSGIAYATNQAVGREVVPASQYSRSGSSIAPEHIELLRAAW